MRHLIVCCDGTWQNVAQQSNVSRIHSAVVTPPGSPEPHYIKGVGISPNPIAVLRGGFTGADLSAGIINGYRWLVETYQAGDRISVFGFSRGAYTARSLAGMIGRVGLVDGSGLDAEAVGDAVDRAYNRYRAIRDDPHDITWSAGLDFAYRAGEPDIPVELIGVWDTVGALGIPAYIGVPDVLGSRKRYEFLDVTLNPRIPHARHAISLDEMRGPFRPTLWRDVDPGQDVKQVWFPGNHMDVGGGNPDKRLSDGALEWMMTEATAAVGISFDRARIPGFNPDPTGFLHGPREGPLGVALEVAFQPRPRATPRVDHMQPEPDVSATAYERQQKVAGYRPTRTLALPGDIAQVVVPADQSWTATGLYLEPGEYRFAASGEWSSAGSRSGPEGDTSKWHFSGNLFSRIVGVAEKGLRAVVNNPEAELLGARREQDLPWLSLVGIVANEVTDREGNVVPDEKIAIGAGTTATFRRPGYLHVFPNDALGFYGNNSGSVQLAVTRS
jgi:hypothetical protein